MKKIALLGVGSHSRNEHIPALTHLLETRNDFTVQAVCDLNQVQASAMAEQLGAPVVLTDLHELLQDKQLDGIISVTPTPLTCDLTCQIMEAGIPVLMEKPLGASMEEAEKVVRCAATTGTPVMVGMNRRHDPVMRQAAMWLNQHNVTYARAVIQRQNRREAGFIEDAALHLVDLLSHVLGRGEVEEVTALGPHAGESASARIRFGQAQAHLEILPACGAWEESYLFSGDGFTLHAVPQREIRYLQHKNKQGFEAPEGTGGRWTTGETEAFLDALQGTAPWSPTPEQVFHSMQLNQSISEQVQSQLQALS